MLRRHQRTSSRRRSRWGVLHLATTLLLLSATSTRAMVHDLVIHNDERALYRIESFCFKEAGYMELEVSDFRAHSLVHAKDKSYRAGFVMRRAASESAAQQELEESLEQKACLLDYYAKDDGGGDHPKKTVFQIELANDKEVQRSRSDTQSYVIQKGEEGLYSLIFARCAPTTGTTSYHLKAKFANPGPRFLSACDAALPTLFAVFFGIYATTACLWIGYLLFARSDILKPHYIHWMMGILVIFKAMAMLAQALRYHYVDRTGSGEGWQFVYYVFASLKGVTLFVVILLIGTGWSLVKPYLSDREKKVVLVVLCLQVVDNVALVVFEETAPGSQQWLTWRDVLHLVDILCCCAILFPIVWSIRHLRRAAAADGKTRDTVEKLTLFRQFYVLVVSYIYFTRIVVFLLAATLPFDLLWLRYVFSEGGTIAFYAVTGYKFRPREDNPYLPLKKDDDVPDDDAGLLPGTRFDEDGDLDEEFGGPLDEDATPGGSSSQGGAYPETKSSSASSEVEMMAPRRPPPE